MPRRNGHNRERGAQHPGRGRDRRRGDRRRGGARPGAARRLGPPPGEERLGRRHQRLLDLDDPRRPALPGVRLEDHAPLPGRRRSHRRHRAPPRAPGPLPGPGPARRSPRHRAGRDRDGGLRPLPAAQARPPPRPAQRRGDAPGRAGAGPRPGGRGHRGGVGRRSPPADLGQRPGRSRTRRPCPQPRARHLLDPRRLAGDRRALCAGRSRGRGPRAGGRQRGRALVAGGGGDGRAGGAPAPGQGHPPGLRPPREQLRDLGRGGRRPRHPGRPPRPDHGAGHDRRRLLRRAR